MGRLEGFRNLSSAIATLVLPVVIAVMGQRYTSALKEREIESKYVELATGILREQPTDQNKALREWATQVIDQYSGVKLSQAAKTALIARQLAYQQSVTR